MEDLFNQVMNFVLVLPTWQQITLGVVATLFAANITRKVYVTVRSIVSGTVKTGKITYSIVTWPFRKLFGVGLPKDKIRGWKDVLRIYKLLEANKTHKISDDVLTDFVLMASRIPYITSTNQVEYNNVRKFLGLKNSNKSKGPMKVVAGPVSHALSELHLRGHYVEHLLDTVRDSKPTAPADTKA